MGKTKAEARRQNSSTDNDQNGLVGDFLYSQGPVADCLSVLEEKTGIERLAMRSFIHYPVFLKIRSNSHCLLKLYYVGEDKFVGFKAQGTADCSLKSAIT